MNGWDMCRAVGRGVVMVGLIMQTTPVAWAQLADIDPALNAAVEALVMADPEVAGDHELAQLCRSVAESTVTDIRERVAVAQEVAIMQREGVDVRSVIPEAVREAAREQFTRVQGDMQRQGEQLRSTDPERAKGIELMMREGERQMTAFQSGEHYVPSTEMVAHAEGMFKGWEADMVAQGAPPEFVERARMEMARWSSGEMQVAFGGPAHEFSGPGPMGGPGGMPSVEQMQAMGMTADQIQAAQAGGHTLDGMTQGPMPSVEQMQAMGMTTEQIQMAQTAMEQGHTGGMYGGGSWEGGSNYGFNPATGGWEPGMGGAVYGGGTTDWNAGGGAYVGTTDWSAGGGTFVEGSNYGINPSTGGWEPNMGGGTVYGGGETWTQTSEGSWVSGGGETFTPSTETHEYWSNQTELAQQTQENKTEAAQTYAHTLKETHNEPGHQEEHWDGNGDGMADHTHPIGTAPH